MIKMSQKSYDNSPTLYLVPTPIGNVDDITLRAIKVFNDVEVIFSEDTRETGILLKHLDVKKKMIANHKFNEVTNKERLLSYLKSGKSVALVTDRGTPIVSDPGDILVNTAIENNYNVVSLPGATALIPALTVSGLDASHFLFYGFLNSKSSKRKQELTTLKNLDYTMIFYEAPHRITETLIDMQEILGNRLISISREISKKYEEVYRGNISQVLEEIKEAKGEMVIVVEKNTIAPVMDNLSVAEHVNYYVRNGYDIKEAMKIVAKERNISKSSIYSDYHKKG
jgi:16S rRNA (cytidine1402-2'-O)-methyltransferase